MNDDLDSVERLGRSAIQAESAVDSVERVGQSPIQRESWEGKTPWVDAGYQSKSTWYKHGRPKAKPTTEPDGRSSVAPQHRRKIKTGHTLKHSTDEARTIRDIIKALADKNTEPVTPDQARTAIAAAGIAMKPRTIYHHFQQCVRLNMVRQDQLALEPRAKRSDSLMAEVIRLATPPADDPTKTTTIPDITAKLVELGHLKPGKKSSSNELVRNYVKDAIADAKIKAEWIREGHVTPTREKLLRELPKIVEANRPINVRGCMYKAMDKGILTDKDENLVSRVLVKLREDEIVDADDITDIRGTISNVDNYTDPAKALEAALYNRRRDPWEGKDTRLLIGVEKNGLAGVVWPVCQKFQVPLIAPGGYGSYTLCKDVAQHVEDFDGLTVVLYFGDFDPDGMEIGNAIEDRVATLAPNSDFEFHRVGLWHHHIKQFRLRTHTVAKRSPRFPKFRDKYGDQGADLDALDQHTFREWVTHFVVGGELADKELERIGHAGGFITADELDRAKRAEQADRAWFEKLLELSKLNPDYDKLIQDERIRHFVKSIS